MADDLTWRFEAKLRGHEGWVPITTDLLRDGERLDCADTHEMIWISQEANDAAERELDTALAGLAEFGELRGMTAAQIVVWDGIGTTTQPACVLEATADQLAVGSLRAANGEVQSALREVEAARSRVRNQIIKAATVDRLGRNTIARVVDGAWSRRLVLKFLAGHDLVEAIQEAVPLRKTWQYLDEGDYGPSEHGEEYLGPYDHGPLRLDLEPNGQVSLRMIDIGLSLNEEISMRDSDPEAYIEGRAKRARQHAQQVLPDLTRAGFRLVKDDGTPANEADLAATVSFGTLLVLDS